MPVVGAELCHHVVLLLPGEAPGYELYHERLALDVVGVAVTRVIAVEHLLVQPQLALHVGEVANV